MTSEALLVVDLENDFMPGGALGVDDGDATVEVANQIMPRFELVIATQDWHPADHGSFASAHPGRVPGDMVILGGVEQVLWPDHCVQSSVGASFHSALDVAAFDHVVRKGTDPGIDSYSAFYDNGHRIATGLHPLLADAGVSRIIVMGLATDYCVKFTVLDGLQLGYDVAVYAPGCRAVALQEGDEHRAYEAMISAGARILDSL